MTSSPTTCITLYATARPDFSLSTQARGKTSITTICPVLRERCSSATTLLFARNKRLEHARDTLNRLFGDKYPERFTPDDVHFSKEAKPDEVALINYTSGSTGYPRV